MVIEKIFYLNCRKFSLSVVMKTNQNKKLAASKAYNIPPQSVDQNPVNL